MDILVIGLGKLGLPIAAVLADAGHKVAAFDKSKDLIHTLKTNCFVSSEPELMNLLNKNSEKITFYSGLTKDILNQIDAVFIVVPTPSLDDGRFSNAFVIEAIHDLGKILQAKKSRTVICIVSTVMPGSCDGEIRQALESSYGEINGDLIGLCYHPEFIALGSVVENLRNPDFNLIGSEQEWAADQLIAILNSASRINVKSMRLRLLEAELVKISINNFITLKISFANSLMQVCESIGDIRIDRLMTAIGLDSRIGSKYIKASVPYGGPCFPRDTKAMSYLFEHAKIPYSLSEVTSKINDSHLHYLLKKIESKIEKNLVIGVLGISYKMGTQVIEESPGVKIVESLNDKGFDVVTWDDEGANLLTTNIPNLSFNSILDRADYFVITRPCKNLSDIKQKILQKNKKFIDLWSL